VRPSDDAAAGGSPTGRRVFLAPSPSRGYHALELNICNLQRATCKHTFRYREDVSINGIGPVWACRSARNPKYRGAGSRCGVVSQMVPGAVSTLLSRGWYKGCANGFQKREKPWSAEQRYTISKNSSYYSIHHGRTKVQADVRWLVLILTQQKTHEAN
jgi:hypothetical protein